MITRTTEVGLTVLLLCGCADTTTSFTRAPVPAAAYSQDQLAEAALYAIQQKEHKLRTRGPKPFDQPAEAHEFFVQQRLSDGQPDYPWPHLAHTRDEILVREQAGGMAAASSAASPAASGAASAC